MGRVASSFLALGFLLGAVLFALPGRAEGGGPGSGSGGPGPPLGLGIDADVPTMPSALGAMVALAVIAALRRSERKA